MKGGAMSGRTANLMAIAVALALFASWWVGIAGASHSGSVFSGHRSLTLLGWLVVPVAIAVGGFAIAMAPSSFPGLAWRLMIAEWIPFAAFLLLILTNSSDCVGRAESCGVEEQIKTLLLTVLLLETLFVNGAIGLGMGLAFARRRQSAAR